MLTESVHRGAGGAHDGCLQVCVHGYSHKLLNLQAKIVEAIVEFKVDKERFVPVRERVEQVGTWCNFF